MISGIARGTWNSKAQRFNANDFAFYYVNIKRYIYKTCFKIAFYSHPVLFCSACSTSPHDNFKYRLTKYKRQDLVAAFL